MAVALYFWRHLTTSAGLQVVILWYRIPREPTLCVLKEGRKERKEGERERKEREGGREREGERGREREGGRDREGRFWFVYVYLQIQ